jgi:hypothetical protein
MSWKPDGGPVTMGGMVFGGKHAEFGKFINLPSRTSQQLELAIGGGLPPRDLLRRHGWHLVDAYGISSDPWKYREYIYRSKAEFSVAKQAYVETRSGWFSCRSACYLALGRPCVLQDTGWSNVYPTGQGLFAFRSLDEAVAAIDTINSDYAAHSRAARKLAEKMFDARTVLAELIAKATA